MYKLFTRIITKTNGNQPREKAGSRKGYSTVNHLQTINQLKEKYNEFKRPLCIGYIDYEKTFDSIEYEAVFKVLRTIGIKEIYFTILEDIYMKLLQEYIWIINFQEKCQY